MEYHNINPIFDEHSKVLILGSFPSVKSREGAFFYDHPQNRFWKVLARVLDDDLPLSHAQKRAFLLKHHIALWDVLASCEIKGSSDASISNAKANDLSVIFSEAPICAVFCNGATALRYYNRYQKPICAMEAVALPSTSPANAAFSLDRLAASWEILNRYFSSTD